MGPNALFKAMLIYIIMNVLMPYCSFPCQISFWTEILLSHLLLFGENPVVPLRLINAGNSVVNLYKHTKMGFVYYTDYRLTSFFIYKHKGIRSKATI